MIEIRAIDGHFALAEHGLLLPMRYADRAVAEAHARMLAAYPLSRAEVAAALAGALRARHETRLIESGGRTAWVCVCGDESGAFESYNDAHDSAIDHEGEATG